MIGAVVLNYRNYECTINCVNKLLSQDFKDLIICVVDNGSKNDSLERLSEEFSNNDRVVILQEPKNIGFAKGNNKGIDYLINKYNCSDILLINSDVYFEEEEALNRLLQYRDANLGIISPIAYSCENDDIENIFISKKQGFYKCIKQELLSAIPRKIKQELCLLKKFLFNKTKLQKTLSRNGRHNLLQDRLNQTSIEDYYVFTGSCFLLTSEFFKYYDGLFNRTFLYYEEWATTILLDKAGLDAIAVDVGAVYHIGGASTSSRLFSVKHLYEVDSIIKILVFLLFGKEYRKNG